MEIECVLARDGGQAPQPDLEVREGDFEENRREPLF